MTGEEKLSFTERLDRAFGSDEMFHETEVQANRLGAIILVCSGFLLALILALTLLGVFPLSPETILTPAVVGITEITVLSIICRGVKYDTWWLKYLLMIGLVFVYARLDSMLTHKAAILMVIPVVFSSRYFSRRFTIFAAVLSAVAFFLSAAWGATHGMINLNIVTMPTGTEIVATGGFLGTAVKNAGVSDEMLTRNTLLYDYLPKLFMFVIAAIISGNIARRGREMVIAQHDRDVETVRMDSELNLAANIQGAMLPRTFPAFPERDDFDIHAVMNPAREVGGDFYDFFLIDDDHLCLAIADVAGKGVPAALFMMASRIVIADNIKMGKSPAQVLTDVNEAICAKNPEEMFVTVWLGILELSTGKLVATNAGHEYPAIKRAGGRFELLRDKHGFVVGGMPGMTYRDYELEIEPGSEFFVYTDGVREAMNGAGELFGNERMLDALNASPDSTPEQLLQNVATAVNAFADGAEQFDDLTMLCVEYKGAAAPAELVVEAAVDKLAHVQDFVDRQLEAAGFPLKPRGQLALAVEEIFVNIASYAYAPDTGTARIRVTACENPASASVTFIDSGVPFDPLAKEDPDITLPADERPIGGLGVFITKQLMDEVTYEYTDGCNILTIRKDMRD